ncbi:MAG TPA: cupin-like domain-containing protein [Caulobacteraceae bacterium]|jgi:hypothetical protein
MTDAMIPAWSAEQKQALGRKALRFAHRLADSGLFTDDALAEMLDACPDGQLIINLYPGDDASVEGFRTGSRGGLNGAEIVQAVKAGRLWLQVSSVQRRHDGLGGLVDRCLDGMAGEVRGFRPRVLSANLLISAPGARVPYHADPVPIVLFHLRGRKRLYVYPKDELRLPQDRLEQIVLETTTEDLPYRREWDADATICELQPGDAVTWPVHAPHRVENLDGLNVSLSIEFLSWPTRFASGALMLNGLLRSRGLPPLPQRLIPTPLRALMWAAAGVAKRVGLTPRPWTFAEREKTFNIATAAQV